MKAQGQRPGKSPKVRSEVTFQSLRHTATSLLKNAGVSEAVARDIIGHESAAISRHYTHIDEGSKRKALAKLFDGIDAETEVRTSWPCAGKASISEHR